MTRQPWRVTLEQNWFQRRHTALLVALVAVIPSGTAMAQVPEPSTRVRVTVVQGSRTEKLVGSVVAADSAEVRLLLDRGRVERVVSRASLVTVDVSRGRSARVGKGLLLGALSGGLAALLYKGIQSMDYEINLFGPPRAPEPDGCSSGCVGAMIGVGAALGTMMSLGSPEDRWERVTGLDAALRHPVALRVDRRGLGLAIKF